jgi:uncharacterized protein YxjI
VSRDRDQNAELPVRKFVMREKMLGLGDDYWIEDEHGNGAFKVDGKLARVRDTWVLEDAHGNDVATIRERKLSVRDAVKIEWAGGEATVRKAVLGFRDRFTVDLDEGEDLKVKGDIVDREYKIERDGDKVAEISKKWFRIRESYGIEVQPTIDPALVIAIAVAVDAMTDNDD